MGHPAIVTIERYKAKRDITDNRYLKFIDSARRETSIYDLVQAIETFWGNYQPLGLWHLVATEINTPISKLILDGIQQELYQFFGNWEQPFSKVIERKKWTIAHRERLREQYESQAI